MDVGQIEMAWPWRVARGVGPQMGPRATSASVFVRSVFAHTVITDQCFCLRFVSSSLLAVAVTCECVVSLFVLAINGMAVARSVVVVR